MSLDLRIERFGTELANRLFVDHRVKGFVPHSLAADYLDVKSELNDDVVKAVKLHMAFFRAYYARVYQELYDQFKQNQMDFLMVVMEAFPHQSLGRDVEEVMSKFVSSCAFLMNMCLVNSNFLDKIHLIWAMFVDLKLKDEFYKSGGWAKLRKYAWIHCGPAYGFMERFSVEDVLRHRVDLTVQSLFGICDFDAECVVGSDLPVGLQWVDFVAKNPSSKRGSEEIEELEVMLESLKQQSDPFEARQAVYEEVIPAAMSVGMGERACMDALASGDFGKYPEFRGAMQIVYGECLRKVPIGFGEWEDSSLESTDETVDQSEDCDTTNSDELDDDGWEISPRTASNRLLGRGYPMKNCIDHICEPPLLPAFMLPTLLKSPSKESEDRFLQEPIPEKRSTETGELSQVEGSSCERFIYNKLFESLQKKFPKLHIKSFSISERTESEQGSEVTPVPLSKLLSMLDGSANLKVVSDSVESKPDPRFDSSSVLSSLPKKKRGKMRQNA